MELENMLRDFMTTPAPSGYEGEMARKFMRYMTPVCDSVKLDKLGNCVCELCGAAGGQTPRVMVFAHMDSLGFIVRKLDDDGFLRADRLGGVPEKVLPGLDVLVRDESGGWHPGVFGVKSHHAANAEEKYKVDPIGEMFIDLGFDSAEAAQNMGIEIGCPAVYAPSFTKLAGERVSGSFVDNRGGCAALVEIARALVDDRPACDVYLVGTVWEEFNLRGAMMAARTVKPDIAISLDVTLSGDTPDLSARFNNRLGGGACAQLYSFHGRGTLNGTLPHEPLFRLVKRAAQANRLPFQRFASLGMLTDASYLQLEGDGVACLEMGFPARYTHTPVEVCDMNDIRGLSALVAQTLRMIDGDFQLARY